MSAAAADGSDAAQQSAELAQIARICHKVPWEPAETFPEALQSLWFTHMLLMVTVADVPFIADVGFGGGGLLHPIPLVEAEPVRHYAWDFRLVREGSGWVLQSFSDGQWMDLYTFTLDRQYRIDYEVANYYVSTHPDAQFTQDLFVQQATP